MCAIPKKKFNLDLSTIKEIDEEKELNFDNIDKEIEEYI